MFVTHYKHVLHTFKYPSGLHLVLALSVLVHSIESFQPCVCCVKGSPFCPSLPAISAIAVDICTLIGIIECPCRSSQFCTHVPAVQLTERSMCLKSTIAVRVNFIAPLITKFSPFTLQFNATHPQLLLPSTVTPPNPLLRCSNFLHFASNL